MIVMVCNRISSSWVQPWSLSSATPWPLTSLLLRLPLALSELCRFRTRGAAMPCLMTSSLIRGWPMISFLSLFKAAIRSCIDVGLLISDKAAGTSGRPISATERPNVQQHNATGRLCNDTAQISRGPTRVEKKWVTRKAECPWARGLTRGKMDERTEVCAWLHIGSFSDFGNTSAHHLSAAANYLRYERFAYHNDNTTAHPLHKQPQSWVAYGPRPLRSRPRSSLSM